MTLMSSLHPNKTLKLFSLKLYKIKSGLFRTRPLNFLVQNFRSFATPGQNTSGGAVAAHMPVRAWDVRQASAHKATIRIYPSAFLGPSCLCSSCPRRLSPLRMKGRFGSSAEQRRDVPCDDRKVPYFACLVSQAGAPVCILKTSGRTLDLQSGCSMSEPS